MNDISSPSPWLCIDFGTCNSAAAILVGGVPKLVTYGNVSFFPTVACVLPQGNIQVCQNAEPLRASFPQFFQQEFKLNIAEPLDINGRNYRDIVAEIIRFIKAAAEIENNGTSLTKLLLTIPAVYTQSDPRIETMRRAAEDAGFEDVDFMSEPIAAAGHYAYVSLMDAKGIYLVYDLGGGTFDPVVLDLTDSTNPRVSGQGGTPSGGQHFDAALYKYVADRFRESGAPLTRQTRLSDYQACRRLKESLSLQTSATQLFGNGETFTVSRAEFEDLIRPILSRTLEAVDAVVGQSGRKWAQINQVLLVGGSTAIPLVTEMLRSHLVSHNAPAVKIVRSQQCANGAYNHLFATCLGGIASKIGAGSKGIGVLFNDTRPLALHEGLNTFGRLTENDYSFEDPHMSRRHFTIEVKAAGAGTYDYILSSVSDSQPTLLNSTEALDKRYVPFCRDRAPLSDGDSIVAGRTNFKLKLK